MERLRGSHESDREWRLREAFLNAHQDRFSKDRLICLSHCFINVEMYGTSYPPGVMRILSELSADVSDDVDELRRQKKQRAEVKFVKASDTGNKSNVLLTKCKSEPTKKPMVGFVKASSEQCSSAGSDALSSGRSGADYWVKNDSVESVVSLHDENDKSPVSAEKSSEPEIRTGNSRRGLGATLRSTKSKEKKSSVVNKVQLDERFTQAKLNIKSEEDRKFYLLAEAIAEIETEGINCISLMHESCAKTKMSASIDFSMNSHQYICHLHIDSVAVAHGMGNNKRTAKYEAYSNAIQSLKKPHLHVDRVNPEKTELKATDEPGENDSTDGGMMKLGQQQVAARGMKRLHPDSQRKQKHIGHSKPGGSLADFIILEHGYVTEPNPISIMHSSSTFNKTKMEFDFSDGRSRLSLNGDLIAEVTPTQEMTPGVKKTKLCEIALGKLRKMCWTIEVKKAHTSETGVSRDEILGEINKQSETLNDSNIGSKMLKKMGWSGGGIGKDGNGISEPIKADLTVIKRQGFGLQKEQGISKDFVENIRITLRNYMRSRDETDLSFTSEFSKEERALIHQEGSKLGLKTQSRGTADERYLIVSRKRDLSQLISHIQRSGGSTSKYELLPPLW
ncbi:NF-kappa-B-repressing factor-like [Tubulanus polymorphus]|uniref:NF-kappa-B-repressing factor-like n=1 Tax=Tubulanus polymorphus TaxID=672921 RepID=UPI003DA3A40E